VPAGLRAGDGEMRYRPSVFQFVGHFAAVLGELCTEPLGPF